MIFSLLFIFFYKKSEEADIKFKRTSVHLEILNSLLNYLNINISEEVNVNYCKSFLVDQQGGWGLVLAERC